MLPPRLAPIHVVIVPILGKKPEEKAPSLEAAEKLARDDRASCRAMTWFGYEPIIVKVDDREQHQPGYKFTEWEIEGRARSASSSGRRTWRKRRLRAGPARPARQGRQEDGRAAGRGAGEDRGHC